MPINLNDIAETIKDRFKTSDTIRSFNEFIEDVEKNPIQFSRNSAQYLKDVFEHYGSYKVRSITGEKIRRWKIFDRFCPVFGQERAQNQIYNYICSFAENKTNKIILLHGPNGSAKTSLVLSIMMAVEEYSRLPEGAVYTFNWIFSEAGERETGLGFGNSSKKYNDESLAYTDADDIVTYGKYLNIWKKQEDGSWRLTIDMGNHSPDPNK